MGWKLLRGDRIKVSWLERRKKARKEEKENKKEGKSETEWIKEAKKEGN